MSARGLAARIKKAGGQEKFAEQMRDRGSKGGKNRWKQKKTKIGQNKLLNKAIK